MKLEFLEGKKILILGLGVTGYEVATSLSGYKNNVIIVDRTLDSEQAGNLKGSGYRLMREEDFLAEDDIEIDLILKSPGVPFDNSVLLKFPEVPCINDIELAQIYLNENELNTKIVGVTGTNGKTTTVMFLRDLLKNAGFSVAYAGNIGLSPLEILDEGTYYDFLIFELSSFQLKSVDIFHPQFSFITNLSTDHLDIHPDFRDYRTAKFNIFKNQNSGDVLYTRGKLIEEISQSSCVQMRDESLSEEFKDVVEPFKTLSVSFKNLILIYKFAKDIGISDSVFIKTATEFTGPEHRLEYLGEIKGIKYYNDSKATNLSAMGSAVDRFTDIILLVGGSSKNEDLSAFDTYLENVKAVVTYGENKDEFVSEKIIFNEDNLEEAFKAAQNLGEEGDVILLSPASASFDQFRNYVERGNAFKELVEGLK